MEPHIRGRPICEFLVVIFAKKVGENLEKKIISKRNNLKNKEKIWGYMH